MLEYSSCSERSEEHQHQPVPANLNTLRRTCHTVPAVLSSREEIKNISPDLQGVGHPDLRDALPHRTPCLAGGTP